MKYNIVYQIIRDAQGEVVDLRWRNEYKTQRECARWLDTTQSEVSKATIKTFTPKHVRECSPIRYAGFEYLIIRG